MKLMPTPRARLGALGESLARRMLQAKGYAIVQTNYRCRWGEIDIVAKQGEELVFVEVRTRSGPEFGAPEESLTQPKTARLISTVESYLQSLTQVPDNWRIDLVSVRMGNGRKLQSIRHLENVVEQ